MAKKRNRAYKRKRGEQKPTEVKALRSLAMADALWDALIRDLASGNGAK